MNDIISAGASRVKTVPFILTANRQHNIAVPLSHLLDMMVNQFSFVEG